jgi:putative ABC transport system permease protein
VLAGVCLLIGAVGIANTTLVAVLERTGEIGLRRSLGAGRTHIGGQIVAESACVTAISDHLRAAITEGAAMKALTSVRRRT